MPYFQLAKFKRGLDAFVKLVGEAQVRVLVTPHTAILRSNAYRTAVAVTIPTCTPSGVGPTAAELHADEESQEAEELVLLSRLSDIAPVVRSVKNLYWRQVLVDLDIEEGNPRLRINGPTDVTVQLARPTFISSVQPSYLSRRDVDHRYETDTLTNLATAGRKIAPTGIWHQAGGLWVIKDSQGLALRVATEALSPSSPTQ